MKNAKKTFFYKTSVIPAGRSEATGEPGPTDLETCIDPGSACETAVRDDETQEDAVSKTQTITKNDKLTEQCVNTIRLLSVDAIEKAKSGHPGLPMGMAPTAYTLFANHMKHNPKNPKWPNRDRFVLSAGHGSMLLY